MNKTYFLPTNNETVEHLIGVCGGIESRYQALSEQVRLCACAAESVRAATSVEGVAHAFLEGHRSSAISANADAAATGLYVAQLKCQRVLGELVDHIGWAKDLIKQAATESLEPADEMNLSLARMVLLLLETKDRLEYCTEWATKGLSKFVQHPELPVRRHFRRCRTALEAGTRIHGTLACGFIRAGMPDDIQQIFALSDRCRPLLDEFGASVGREAPRRGVALDNVVSVESLAFADDADLMRRILDAADGWARQRAEKVRREILSGKILQLLDEYATLVATVAAKRDPEMAPVNELLNLIAAAHEIIRSRAWLVEVDSSSRERYNGHFTERALHGTIERLYANSHR